MSPTTHTQQRLERSPQNLSEVFAIAGGTVRGREHRRLLRNNQDAFAWRIDQHLAIATVADGCSGGSFSEVGAQLAVRWVVDHMPQIWREMRAATASELAHTACDQLTAYLSPLVSHHSVGSPTRAEFVESLLLFTLLVAVVDPNSATVFGVGDGVISINGDPVSIGVESCNHPDYLGYRLLPESLSDASKALSQPQVHFESRTSALESLVVGSDGCIELLAQPDVLMRDGRPVGDLSQFEAHSRYLRNPSLLQKRLTVIGELNGHLWDDTTLVVIRRRGGRPCKS